MRCGGRLGHWVNTDVWVHVAIVLREREFRFGRGMKYEDGCGLVREKYREFITFDHLRKRTYLVVCMGRVYQDK